jgi:predicted dehydrogenase
MAHLSTQPVKVGVVGCGVVATAYYLPYLMQMDNVDLVAVCDLHKTRTEACARLFGAREQYLDYYQMIDQADLDAVFILTAPGTHVPFTLAAVEAGKHVLIQKPMATTMEDAQKIADAVRKAGVKAVIEPSSSSILDPDMATIRKLVQQGVLGDVMWFSLGWTGPTKYGPELSMNPYGQAAFFDEDSGGFLFDLPYAPANIVGVLGACKSIMGHTATYVTDHKIVPEQNYDDFLAAVTDPHDANYWDLVLDMPKTLPVTMKAVDNAYSLYEMADGSQGVCHVGRIFHPVLPGVGFGDLQVYGTEGNLFFGGGHYASIISSRHELLPNVSEDGWFHIPLRGDRSKAAFPKPIPGAFNYYHESSQHFIDCIVHDREPIVGLEWGLHLTEMMYGTLVSSQTGKRYEMTTTLSDQAELIST